MTTQRLSNRIILVTGASRGIGRAVALAYAKEGAHVIALGRSAHSLEALDDDIRSATGRSAILVPCDLTQGDMIDQLGYTLAKRYGHIDVLVGNAAILGTLTPLHHLSPSVWNDVMQVNVTANWRLIRSLDPLLKQSQDGRALFVTADVATHPTAYWSAYAVSKAALKMLADIYALECAGSSVRVECIDPGMVSTDMFSQAYPGRDPTTVPSPQSLTERFVHAAKAQPHSHPTPPSFLGAL